MNTLAVRLYRRNRCHGVRERQRLRDIPCSRLRAGAMLWASTIFASIIGCNTCSPTIPHAAMAAALGMRTALIASIVLCWFRVLERGAGAVGRTSAHAEVPARVACQCAVARTEESSGYGHGGGLGLLRQWPRHDRLPKRGTSGSRRTPFRFGGEQRRGPRRRAEDAANA